MVNLAAEGPPHSEDRIEEAAMGLIAHLLDNRLLRTDGFALPDNAQHYAETLVRPILQRLYDDGKKAGAEEAAKERDHYKALWDADRARELREDIAARRTTL